MNKMRVKVWTTLRWTAALLLAGLAAWLSLRQVRWPSVQTILTGASLPLLALALSTVLATTVAKALRWQALLRLCGPPPGLGRLLRLIFIGQMGNSLLPARLGDVARAALVGPQTGGGFLAAMGTLLAEKALDGALGLLILIGLALWTLPGVSGDEPLPGWLRGPLMGLAALTGGLLAVLALAAIPGRTADRLFAALTRPLPTRFQERLRRWLAGLGLGLSLLRRPGDAWRALVCSALVWGLAALTNVVTLAALDIQTPGWSTWLVLVTGYAVNFLPPVPAQIGLFEYACILALAAAGVGHEPALAFGLVLHLLVSGPPALLGPVSMAAEGLSWGRLWSGPLEDTDGTA